MLARNFVMALAIAAVGLMFVGSADAGLLRGRRSSGNCSTCGTTATACNACNAATTAAAPAVATADPAPPPAEVSPNDMAAPKVAAQPTTTTTYRNASTKARRGLLGRYR